MLSSETEDYRERVGEEVSIEKELARRRHLVAAEGIAKRHAAQQKEARRLMTANRAPVTNPDGVDTSFAAQLKKRAEQVKAQQEHSERPDLPEVIAQLRKEGKLPPPTEPATAYVPTPEEILGPDIVESSASNPHETEELPSPDQILNQSPVPVMQQALAPNQPLRHNAFRSRKNR